MEKDDDINENKEEIKVPKKFKIKKENMWKYATFITLILLVASVMVLGKANNCVSGAVSADVAAANAIDFINTNMLPEEVSAQLNNVSESNGIYAIDISVGGQDYTSYITKDGKLLFTAGVKIEEAQTQEEVPPANTDNNADVPKKDKPEVELFIMSHCPYGTQMEKGFIPVAEKFGDKINWNVKFVYYVMHGETEVNEQLLQYCIQKDDKDLYLSYLKCFLKEGDTDACLAENNIEKEDYKTCLEETDNEYAISENLNDNTKWLSGRFPLFSISKEENEKYGIAGSPAFVINGVKMDSQGRSAQSIQETICDAFTDRPDECDESLSSANPSPGFGYSESDSAVTDASCE